MSRITVDQSKCNGCGLCMQVCILGNFEPGDDGKVHPAEGLECFDCGHCAAICPTEAMGHASFADEGFERIDRANLPDYDLLMDLLKARRSRREFTDEPLSDEMIGKLLHAAIHAPSCLNTNSVQYTVITNRETISAISTRVCGFFARMQRLTNNPVGNWLFRKMTGGAYRDLSRLLPLIDLVTGSDADLVLYDAPCVILQHAPKTSIFAEADYCYAAQNILLAAETLGLGACVIGLVTDPMNRDKSMKALAGIPANHKVYCTITLGHPKFHYKRTAPKLQPTVNYIK